MKTIVFMCFMIFLLAGCSVYAMSFGRDESANVTSIDGKPAICLPIDADEVFPVGWVSLSQSYVRSPGAWGVMLQQGAKPLALRPGDCLVLGIVPEGYELDSYKVKTRTLTLEVNKTYVFSMTDALHSTDTYAAVFCIERTAEGGLEYKRYINLPDGSELVPSCDARLNGNVLE